MPEGCKIAERRQKTEDRRQQIVDRRPKTEDTACCHAADKELTRRSADQLAPSQNVTPLFLFLFQFLVFFVNLCWQKGRNPRPRSETQTVGALVVLVVLDVLDVLVVLNVLDVSVLSCLPTSCRCRAIRTLSGGNNRLVCTQVSSQSLLTLCNKSEQQSESQP